MSQVDEAMRNQPNGRAGLHLSLPVQMLFYHGQVAKKLSEGPSSRAPGGRDPHNKLPLFLCLALVST